MNNKIIVGFEPIPAPVEGCDHPRWQPAPTVHGTKTPAGDNAMRCERCWVVAPEDKWPELREEFDRETAIVHITEYWRDLSEYEKHDWFVDSLELMTTEKLFEWVKEIYS